MEHIGWNTELQTIFPMFSMLYFCFPFTLNAIFCLTVFPAMVVFLPNYFRATPSSPRKINW